MEILREPLPGLLVIKPDVYEDDRGFFLETWQKNRYKEIGIEENFVQDNWSRSIKGVLRGLHFQKRNPQGKLINVHKGKVFDVAVDIRERSSTFGEWHAEELSDSNHLQMYVPPGFAHGFCVLSHTVDFFYKCTEFYYPEDEDGIIWNDPEIGIDWPLTDPLISPKDNSLNAFRDLYTII